MSFFARASWPGDHRDEIVAGALVAAVVVVLGYASGIGAPGTTTVDTASPPASAASPTPRQPTSRSETGPPPDSATGNYGFGSAGDYPAGDSGAGIPVADQTSGGESGHGHGTGGTGGAGQQSSSPPPSPSSTPTPSPSAPDSCGEGEVRLVQPLLNGVVSPVPGLLDSLLAPAPASTSPAPSLSPSSSLCVGVAASPSVLPEVLP
ncbi:hypothetical protein ABZZ74_04490 [Streptomyces sp. NPDC006476]|uniref:hypothetical protein n=1 Tax=Streptomyces sp. NPDC006476 TaxID=3157175 RepID=UPI0033A0E8E7